MATASSHSTRPPKRTVRFKIDEDQVPITTIDSTLRSGHTTLLSRRESSTSSAISSRARSPAVPVSSRSPLRCEIKRPKVIATADFRGTNPIIDEEIQEEDVARIPTLDDRGHINFTSSRYQEAVDIARARDALPTRSARALDPYSSISPPRTSVTQPFDVPDDHEEERCKDPHNERRSELQQQDTTHFRDRGHAREQSIDANWTYSGHSHLDAFLRLGSGVVLVLLVGGGLLFWPVLASAMLTTILLCVCCYEHAWLSFRIHSRLLTTYQWYEKNEGPNDAGDAMGTSTCSGASPVYGYQEDEPRSKTSFLSSGFTRSSDSFPTEPAAIDFNDENKGAFTLNDEDSSTDPIVAEAKAVMLELEISRGVLLGMANFLCRGNLWLTRLVAAALLTICWSIAATMAFSSMSFPVARTPTDIASAPYYFWVVNSVASLCALSCPTWPRAVSLVVQKSVFEVVLLNALNCPLAASVDRNAAPITSLQGFAWGAMVLMMVHSLSARGPVNLVVGLLLDLLGYAYITGALGLLIIIVDASDRKFTWAAIWLGLLSAMWVAQFAGYVCDAIMSRFQLPHMRLLPPHIIVTLNVEASICAMAAGSVVLVFGGTVLDVPGGVLPKVVFSTGSVLMARFGWLVISVLKKAAGVRWSGCLMPGFGGALDGTYALLFTSIVFVKYYLYVTARQPTSEMDDQSDSGDSVSWATVTFSTDLSR